MSIYIIAQFAIHDRELYSKYEEGFMDVFEKFDGRMLSVDEAPTLLQGEWSATRSVLIEFPSQQAAMDWMTSPAYLKIAKDRLAASTGNVIMVKGGEDNQL